MSGRVCEGDTPLVVGLVIAEAVAAPIARQHASDFHRQDLQLARDGQAKLPSGLANVPANEMLTGAYSPTGQFPATHFGCAAVYPAEQWERIVDYAERHETPMTCAVIASHAAYLDEFERQQVLGSRRAQRDAVQAFEKKFLATQLLRRID